jgi:hypothetical protein
VVLNHTLGDGADLGILTHFWTTGDVDSNVIVEYFIDGEAIPSIAFEPSLATGQGFPQDVYGDPISQGGLYAAGQKMGKAGAVGGYYLKLKIPFQSNVVVQTRLIDASTGCKAAYMILRGYEAAPTDPGVVALSGFILPRAARMQLQVIENTTFNALNLVSVANVSAGFSALLVQSTIATSTHPVGNNYIEGCWHLYRSHDEPWPGLIVGTGFEDFYNSAYWFGAASGYPNGILYAQAESGLTHFSRGPPQGPDGLEQLSAYRFLDNEVVAMANGGRLIWRVGDENAKCTSNGTVNIIGTPSATAVKSYTWLYAWPNGEPVVPLPELEQTAYITYACVGEQCVLVPDETGPYVFADCDSACTSPAPDFTARLDRDFGAFAPPARA